MGKIIGVVAVVVIAIVGYVLFQNSKSMSSPTNTGQTVKPTGSVKEFTATAYYDEMGVWYSLKEMRVKKGDTVRLTITNIKGMHDLTLDEFGIKKELPLNEAVIVEFTADKTGEFVYYCSKPGHRDNGQSGKLIVE